MPESIACTYETCPHGPGILEITRLVESLGRDVRATSERMEARDLMMIDALKGVANQGARLDAQERRLDQQAKAHDEAVAALTRDVDNLFNRVGGLEKAVGEGGSTLSLVVESAVDKRISEKAKDLDEKLDKIIRFVTICSSWPALLAAGTLAVMTVAGTILDLWYHFKGVTVIWNIYKGMQA